MSARSSQELSANLARPLAFTLLMLYGLLLFLTGYNDWHTRAADGGWSAWIHIICGVLLGSAAIRVIRRRRRAFGLSLTAILLLHVLGVIAGLFPLADGAWQLQLGRLAMSAGMLWLVWRSDAALPAPEPARGREVS